MITEKKYKSDAEIYGYFKCELKCVMLSKNISRTKLSKLTNVKYDIINKYYQSRCKQIDLGTIAKICCILECDIQDLIVYVSIDEEKNNEE